MNETTTKHMIQALEPREIYDDEYRDYVLTGDSCWIEVGDKVMYIRQSNGRCIIEVTPVDDAGETIDTFSFGI